jgi:hypothetical protein
MPTITRFEEIEAWQTARELTRSIYLLSTSVILREQSDRRIPPLCGGDPSLALRVTHSGS